jgi:hypothetical protein
MGFNAEATEEKRGVHREEDRLKPVPLGGDADAEGSASSRD